MTASVDAIAFHEAGHASAYLHYERPFVSVWVGDDTGAVELISDKTCDPCIYAVIALAGPVAESYYTGATIESVLAGTFDLQNAQRALVHRGNDAFEAALAWAAAIVAGQWPLVERIACELLRCGRLDYAVVRRLDDHMSAKG